jgi:hypothetical protein
MRIGFNKSVKLFILVLLSYSAFNLEVQAQAPECKFLRHLLVERWNYAKAFKRDKALHKKTIYAPPKDDQFFAGFVNTGGGEDTYSDLNIDNDGKKDEVITSCGSGIGRYENGCALEVKLSSGSGYLKNDLGAITIVTYMKSNYVLETSSIDPTKTKMFIDKIMPNDLKRICEFR